MSLYNNIANSGLASSFLGMVDSTLKGGLASVGSEAAKAFGGGELSNRIADRVTTIGGAIASNAVNSHIPSSMRNVINGGADALGHVLDGDLEGAAVSLFDSGLADELIGGIMQWAGSQTRYWSKSSPLYGGITPTEAKNIYSEVINTKRAKKNLFLIEVSSPLMGDFSSTFNLFCTDIEHNPISISGEKAKVGSAFVDIVNGSDPDELRITTLDDKKGTLKKWFEQHAAAAAARDGTVGVPGTYAITFTIKHAFVGTTSGFKSRGLFRAASYDVSLSRREDALEEVQMTFTQIDTFMRP